MPHLSSHFKLQDLLGIFFYFLRDSVLFVGNCSVFYYELTPHLMQHCVGEQIEPIEHSSCYPLPYM